MRGANITNVNLTCAAPTSLSVTAPATAVIPVGTGTPGTLTVNNTGNQPALNVRVALPSGWTGVTQDASGCTNVAVGGNCTISLTSTLPYIAQGGISVTGDNVNSPGTAALATSIGGFQSVLDRQPFDGDGHRFDRFGICGLGYRRTGNERAELDGRRSEHEHDCQRRPRRRRSSGLRQRYLRRKPARHLVSSRHLPNRRLQFSSRLRRGHRKHQGQLDCVWFRRTRHASRYLLVFN